jgi:general secretion pathway protein G
MRTRHHRSPGASGFTLIELLIVVAIIGIIAAIAVPALQFALDRAKQRATMNDMRMIGGAVQQYYLDHSIYPNGASTVSQLATLVRTYTGTVPQQDRWGHDFGYASDQKNYYSLESYGKDGIDGTDISFATRNDFDLDLVYSSGQFVHSPEP